MMGLPSGRALPSLVGSWPGKGGGCEIRRRYPADSAVLAEVRALVKDFLLQAAVPDDDADLMTLAVSEAAANSVEHSSTPTIDVRLSKDAERIEIEVLDEGVFASDGRHDGPVAGDGAAADTATTTGPATDHYGFFLMRTAFDDVELRGGTTDRPGTSVRLGKRR